MGLVLCNNYPRPISTAIAFFGPETCVDPPPFELMGWWNIAPGSCALVYANDLADLNRFWYFHARSVDSTMWTGPFRRSAVPLAAFHQCWGVATSGGGPQTEVAFRELDVGDNDDITLTFASR